MTLDFPTRVRPPRRVEQVRQVNLGEPAAPGGPPAFVGWLHRHRRTVVVGVFVVFVFGFSRAWTGGALVLDGPGTSLYVRLMLDHLSANHSVPYWLPELWAGAPIWAVTPTLPLFMLVPLATALGPAVATKLGILGFQVLGAVGAFVLARTLWRNVAASVVAGILFGLQPIVISHGALAGSFGTVGAMVTAPWLAWTLRRGLRGDGPVFVVLSGLLAGFAVLMQAEYAIGLALLCLCLAAVEAGRVGTGRNPASPLRLVGRVVAVVGVALGATAYWLLPFAALGKSFILSPPELVQGELLNGSGARVGREIGVFFDRAHELTGAVGYSRNGLLPLFFHMGWACLALTLVTIAVLPRKDRDGTLTAILLSSALGIWLATGAVPLASSGPVVRGEWLPMAAAGLVAGALLGTLLRPLRLGRAAPVFLVAAVAFLVAVPYLTPFTTMQKVVPLFSSLRFPRFYTVAPLGLALGAAYPVVLAQEWAERHRARSAPPTVAPALAGAVALAVLGVFLVDIWPYRTFYQIRPPANAAAYRQVAASLSSAPGQFRLAPTQIEPTAVTRLLDTGRDLTIGWPHFVAGKLIWRLTAEPFLAPNAYRERAYGLSATGFQVAERYTGKGTSTEAVPAIDLSPNPAALPMVRTYAHTVTMATDEVTPELAVGLAQRNVGVVTGSPDSSPALKATTVVDVRSAHPCSDPAVSRVDAALASQIGVACGLHSWLGTLFAGVDLVNVQPGVGAVFRSTADRLQGISVYLDRVPDRAELALYEVVPGSDTLLGRELARGRAVGADENGLTAFTFDAIDGAAGRQYAWVLTCPDCAAERVPRLVVGHAVDQPGNLIIGAAVQRDRAAAFTPIYDPVAADPPSTTTVQSTSSAPGSWRIRVAGDQPALVVVAEAWFPGWEAQVDGRKAQVLQADGAFLGVPVDAGTHVITLRYHRPAAAWAGRAITVGTLLSLVVLAVRRRRAAAAPAVLPAGAAAPATATRWVPRSRPTSVPPPRATSGPPPPPGSAPPRPRVRPRSKYAPPETPLPERPARAPAPSPAPPPSAPPRRPPPAPVGAGPASDESEWDLVVRPRPAERVDQPPAPLAPAAGPGEKPEEPDEPEEIDERPWPAPAPPPGTSRPPEPR